MIQDTESKETINTEENSINSTAAHQTSSSRSFGGRCGHGKKTPISADDFSPTRAVVTGYPFRTRPKMEYLQKFIDIQNNFVFESEKTWASDYRVPFAAGAVYLAYVQTKPNQNDTTDPIFSEIHGFSNIFSSRQCASFDNDRFI
jgi:hypothetical protein